MEGVETQLAASAVAVITALLWTPMKGIALVSSSALRERSQISSLMELRIRSPSLTRQPRNHSSTDAVLKYPDTIQTIKGCG